MIMTISDALCIFQYVDPSPSSGKYAYRKKSIYFFLNFYEEKTPFFVGETSLRYKLVKNSNTFYSMCDNSFCYYLFILFIPSLPYKVTSIVILIDLVSATDNRGNCSI